MRLILVRHGQTDWNKEYRVQGQSDTILNDHGKSEAEALAGALKDEALDAIYSSTLARAMQTAEAINAFHHVELTPVDALKELDVGETDGTCYPDMATLFPDLHRVWRADPAAARWPGGESLSELQERAWAAVNDIIENSGHNSVLIISHLFVINVLLCRILGMGISDFRRLDTSVASISVVEFAGDKVRLVSFNDTCHLR
ncbi:MAG: histidine phosphatase family protein [Dehalococcoidia bacterium]